jgi:N-acetylglutamate synthase-like GNAT family acetyltransferase
MDDSVIAEITLREAGAPDTERICALLAEMRLGTDNVLAPGTRYWLAERADGALTGVIGLEFGDSMALLRSAVVLPAWRGRGVGAALTDRALAEAAAAGCRQVYLFSTGAGPYWQRFGFQEVPVPELVAALPDAPQVHRYQALGWLPTEVAWRRSL